MFITEIRGTDPIAHLIKSAVNNASGLAWFFAFMSLCGRQSAGYLPLGSLNTVSPEHCLSFSASTLSCF